MLVQTVQSAIDEIVTNAFCNTKRKRTKQVPHVTTYCPIFKNLNSILTNNLPILYTNKRMANLFKLQPMTVFKRPMNLQDMVVRARLDNPLPNGGSKTCSDARCVLCNHSTNKNSFISPITCRIYKYWATRLVALTIASISSVARFALNNTLGKQVTSTEETTFNNAILSLKITLS